MTKHYDVIVVGAGLTGLSAGRKLKENDINYLIIEAHDRCGGKVFSAESNGQELELGAQYVNEDMTEMLNLIQEAGMEVKQTSRADEAVTIDSQNLMIVDSIVDKLNEILFHDEIQNDMTLYELYKERLKDENHIKIAASNHSELDNNNPKDISSKYLQNMEKRYPSDKDDTTHQASGPLSNVVRFLESFSKDKIIFEDPVISIKENDGNYHIKTKNDDFTAEKVILTAPPTPASRISYSDSIKSRFQDALESYLSGAVIKVSWMYDKPFWHHYKTDEGEIAINTIIFTDHEGMVVADSTREGDEKSRLTAFIGGDLGRKLANDPQKKRQDFVLERLVDVLGCKAKDYMAMKERVWVDDLYYDGGYGEIVKENGNYNADEILRQPYNNFIFANTQTTPEFSNFMEGAVRAGKYAVEAIL